ncbi:MAG TPA: YoaK family protein [Streptosporangiaceae bacterium]
MRDSLVVLLTLTTGAVDVTSFLALGNVFSSVVTGDMVLLGAAAGTGRPELAVHSGVALAGYMAGVLAGAPLADRWHHHATGAWPTSVTVTLAVELVILVAFTVGWELAGTHPSGGGQLALVAVLAAAMGLQAAAVRRLGQMSTTYLTSTLTALVAGLVAGSKPDGMARSLGVLATLIIGAIAASVLLKEARAWVPLVILVPLGLVIVASVAGFEWVRDHLTPSRGR